MKRNRFLTLLLALVAHQVTVATQGNPEEYIEPSIEESSEEDMQAAFEKFLAEQAVETEMDSEQESNNKPLSKKEKRKEKLGKLGNTMKQAFLIPTTYVTQHIKAGEDWANLVKDPEKIKTVAGNLWDTLGKSVERTKGFTRKGWNAAGEFIDNPEEALKKTKEGVKKGAEKTADIANTVGQGIKKGVLKSADSVVQGTQNAVKEFKESPKEAMKQAWNATGRGIKSIGKGVKVGAQVGNTVAASFTTQIVASPELLRQEAEFAAGYPVAYLALTAMDIDDAMQAGKAGAKAGKAAVDAARDISSLADDFIGIGRTNTNTVAKANKDLLKEADKVANNIDETAAIKTTMAAKAKKALLNAPSNVADAVKQLKEFIRRKLTEINSAIDKLKGEIKKHINGSGQKSLANFQTDFIHLQSDVSAASQLMNSKKRFLTSEEFDELALQLKNTGNDIIRTQSEVTKLPKLEMKLPNTNIQSKSQVVVSSSKTSLSPTKELLEKNKQLKKVTDDIKIMESAVMRKNQSKDATIRLRALEEQKIGLTDLQVNKASLESQIERLKKAAAAEGTIGTKPPKSGGDASAAISSNSAVSTATSSAVNSSTVNRKKL